MIRSRFMLKKFSIPLFFLLTYAWSWGCWYIVSKVLEVYYADLQGVQTILTVSSIPIIVRIAYVIAMLSSTFGPAFSAVFLTAAIDGKDGLREFFARIIKWRVGIRYYLVIFLIPPAMLVLQSGIFIILGGKPQTNLANFSFIALVGIFISNLLRSGGQEELGFRGYVLPNLQKKFNPFVSSLIIGVLWFGWHLPLYLLPHFTQPGKTFNVQTLMNGLLMICLSFTFTWMYNRTQSILMPMLLHAVFNSVADVVSLNLSHPHPSGWIIAWLSAIIPWLILGFTFLWKDRNISQITTLKNDEDLINLKGLKKTEKGV